MIKLIIWFFLPSLARFIESYRDAEIFQYPIDNRSFLWHFLKGFQYGFWSIWGYFTIDLLIIKFNFMNVLVVVISLCLAWIVFEVSLCIFKKYIS